VSNGIVRGATEADIMPELAAAAARHDAVNFGEDGIPVDLAPRPTDTYTWTAYLYAPDDESEQEVIGEFHERPFGSLDLSRCYAVELHPTEAGKPMFCVQAKPENGDRVVFTRRRTSPWVLSGEGEWRTVHVLGVKRGNGSESYLFFDAEGHVVMADDFNLL
jgi:hypothetical protein